MVDNLTWCKTKVCTTEEHVHVHIAFHLESFFQGFSCSNGWYMSMFLSPDIQPANVILRIHIRTPEWRVPYIEHMVAIPGTSWENKSPINFTIDSYTIWWERNHYPLLDLVYQSHLRSCFITNLRQHGIHVSLFILIVLVCHFTSQLHQEIRVWAISWDIKHS